MVYPTPVVYPSGFFYRTQAGAEIDLLLVVRGELWAIEIKRNTAPTVSRGFHIASEDLKPARRYVIYPGEDTYVLKEGVTVSPLGAVIDDLRKDDS